MFSSGKYLENLKKNNNNIYIVQKEKPNYNSQCNLLFMYKPFVNTILQLAPQSKFLYKNWENVDFNANDIIILIILFYIYKHFSKRLFYCLLDNLLFLFIKSLINIDFLNKSLMNIDFLIKSLRNIDFLIKSLNKY